MGTNNPTDVSTSYNNYRCIAFGSFSKEEIFEILHVHGAITGQESVSRRDSEGAPRTPSNDQNDTDSRSHNL